MLSSDLSNFLVHRDGVAVGGTDLSASEINVNTVVVVANTSWMVKATDRSDYLPVLFQRFERTGKLIIFSRLRDLVIQRMDPVGKVHEGTSTGS